MNELQLLLLSLIEEELSVNDISKRLNISIKNVYYQLRLLENKGIYIDKKYNSDGSIIICFRKDFKDQNRNKIHNCSDEFSFVASSDNHLGSPKQAIENSEMMYDYCIENNKHIIINTGDFFSGKKPGWTNVRMALLSQFERGISDYPYDESILNFLILGNHDMAYFKEGINLLALLNKERNDFIPLDYYRDHIKVNNEIINLIHDSKYIRQLANKKMVLYGHYHKYKIDISKDSEVYIGVPAISNISVNGENTQPGFLDFNIKFKDGNFDEVHIKQIGCSNKKLVLSNETTFKY